MSTRVLAIVVTLSIALGVGAGLFPHEALAAQGRVTSVRYIQDCVWDISMEVTGLRPGSRVQAWNDNYTYDDCRGNTGTKSWGPHNLGTADSSGRWTYTHRHNDFGSYHWRIQDDSGQVVRIDLTYDQNYGRSTPPPTGPCPSNNPSFVVCGPTPGPTQGPSQSVDAAGLDSQIEYPTINSGETSYIWIKVKNTGSTTWRSGCRDGYGYEARDGWASSWGTGCLWRDVAPGGTIEFADTVNPASNGPNRYGFLVTRNGRSIGPYFFIDVVVRARPTTEIDRASVVGWISFSAFGPSHSARVSIRYRDPSDDRSRTQVIMVDDVASLNCIQYMPLTGLDWLTGNCYEFEGVPRHAEITLTTAYLNGGPSKVERFRMGRFEPFHWVGVSNN